MKPYHVMKVRRAALVIALIALILLPCMTLTEGNEPATPTDLCTHEHTHLVVYFDDSPQYTPISRTQHQVQGAGLVEVLCDDCGQLLSSEHQEQVEEVRDHTIRNGKCALCGYRVPKDEDLPVTAEDIPGEATLRADKVEESRQWELSITKEELEDLKKDQVQTALIRGAEMEAGFVFSIDNVCGQMKTAGMHLMVTMEKREENDYSLFARLLDASGEEDPAVFEQCFLRFYQPKEPPLTLVWTSPENELKEIAGIWFEPGQDGEEGFWAFPWPGSGSFLLKKAE